MDVSRATLFALLFVGIIIGANAIMYVVARSSIRKGDSKFLKTFRSLGESRESETEKDMGELRKRVAELEKHKPQE